MRRFVGIAALSFTFASVILTAPVSAVILHSSANRNTSAPTGSLANSGWQWQGQFGNFSATVISKKYIITAGHFNAAVGTSLVINGNSHRTVQMWGDPETDLRIYKCVGTFASWAPLWKDSSDTGRSVVLFGRGTQRGEEVRVNGELKGWKWGTEDAVRSWGRNSISEIADGGEEVGQLLRMPFNAELSASSEGHLSRGDSGGGVFAKRGPNWTLVGVNYSTEGPYSLTTNGPTFDAAIFDQGGLWSQGTGMVNNTSQNIPGASYATRLSPRINWISDVFNGRVAPGDPGGGGGIPVPEPSSAMALGGTALATLARRRHN
jgi:hypothetical protein